MEMRGLLLEYLRPAAGIVLALPGFDAADAMMLNREEASPSLLEIQTQPQPPKMSCMLVPR